MTLRSQTLLVLGAGASKEVGFPLGTDLRDQLANMLAIGFEWREQKTGDPVLGRYIQDLAQNDLPKAQALLNAALSVAKKLPQVSSIDALLSLLKNENAIAVAKMAIVRAIAAAEKNSHVYRDDKGKFDASYFTRLSGTWYGKFFDILHQRVPLERLSTLFDNLTVISFNYDRSFEEFLYRALRNLYDLDDHAAAEVMKPLAIHRPYGRIAPLDWQSKAGTAYGKMPALEKAPTSIRTFSEQIAEESLQTAIDTAIEDSERIVFLGFGFIDENLDVLEPKRPTRRKPIRGTAYAFSDSNKEHVEERLDQWLEDIEFGHLELGSPSVRLESKLTCAEFLDQFSRFMMA